eukprot:1569834-Prorocentrum_lima.AAC.1
MKEWLGAQNLVEAAHVQACDAADIIHCCRNIPEYRAVDFRKQTPGPCNIRFDTEFLKAFLEPGQGEAPMT